MRAHHMVMHVATQAGWWQGDAWAGELAYVTPSYDNTGEQLDQWPSKLATDWHGTVIKHGLGQ